MDNVLVKTTTVLELAAEAFHWVDFAHPQRSNHPNTRSETAVRRFTLDRQSWEDLGKPQRLTVTCVPGDVISEEDNNV